MSSSFTLKKPTGVRLILVTGASRSGKTRYTERLAREHRSIQIVHQDTHYLDYESLPKLTFPASVKSTRNWDSEGAVDWYNLHVHVTDAMKLAAAALPASERVVVVDGTELLADDALCAAADAIVLLEVPKWTCFERRINSGRRDYYLPYLDQMWLHYRSLVETRASRHTEKLCIVANGAEPPPLAELRPSGADAYAAFLKRLADDSASKHPGFVPLHEFSVVHEKLTAAFVCHALGDAAGAPYEFPRGRQTNLERFELVPLVHVGRRGPLGAAAGAVTDDHMMALQLARSIVANGNRYDKERAILAYIEWAQAGPSGIGRNTRALFQGTRAKQAKGRLAAYRKAFVLAHDVPTVGASGGGDGGEGDGEYDDGAKLKPHRSVSNGSLMRCVGVLVQRGTRADVQEAAVADASVSNNWPENRAVNRLYAGLLWDLVFGERSLVDVARWADEAYIRANAYSKSVGDAESVVREARSALHSDEVRVTLEGIDRGLATTALWAALRTARDFGPLYGGDIGETLRAVINRGGDTDTNAAITGALLGASVGWSVLIQQQGANVETVLNVPYQYCTVKNVCSLEPRTVESLLNDWAHNNRVADAGGAVEGEDDADDTDGDADDDNASASAAKKQRTQ